MKKIFSAVVALALLVCLIPDTRSFAVASQEPQLVKTVYPTRDVVVADIVLTEEPYNADNSGETDCAGILQKAINDLFEMGGGTIFLPVGRYRLCSQIIIKPFVTVMGDWQDPDKGNEVGTLIVADVESSDTLNPALFNVGGSAGAVGLAVWYPDQKLDNVKPYPYTFYVDGYGSNYMLSTVRNCTLINSYRGIGACTECLNDKYQCHEMFIIENVKGTCLFEGLSSYNSADVDTVKTLYFSGKYWTEYGQEYNAPDIARLNDYTRKHLSAYILGDLEWPELCDLKADNCNYGIHIVNGVRASFSATLFDVYITESNYGIYAEKGAVMHRGKQWGYSVCNGAIDGSVYAVFDKNEAVAMFTNVEIKGKVSGRNIHREKASTDQYKLDYDRTYEKNAENLFVLEADKTGRTDVSSTVQRTLDLAGQSGGIVYLPAGLYRFDNPVSVPEGVELRGSGAVAGRCESGCSKGTLILAYYGYLDEVSDAEPLITLEGDKSGLFNIRINYLKNCPRDDSGSFKETSAAVYSESDDIHVIDCFVILGSEAINLNGCENAYLLHNVGCCYHSFIDVDGCSNLQIEGCLQNANALPRNGYSSYDIPELNNWLTEDKLFDYVFIPITRIHTDYLIIRNSGNVTVFNTFIYGGRRLMYAENSDILAVNVGSDGSSKTFYTYTINGGKTVVIGTMHSTSNGKGSTLSFETDGNASLKMYDRITVDLAYNEFTVLKNPENLNSADTATLNKQIFYRIYEFFGKLFTKK